MITIECQISGSQIAESLINDEDELYYFFQAFCDQRSKTLSKNLAANASSSEMIEFAECFENWAKTFREIATEQD